MKKKSQKTGNVSMTPWELYKRETAAIDKKIALLDFEIQWAEDYLKMMREGNCKQGGAFDGGGAISG